MKYNKEERIVARKIEQLTKYLNKRKGTTYQINKKEHIEMRINWLNSSIGWKYNNIFEKKEMIT